MKTDKKCQHQMPRSPSHPIADLTCGATAKQVVNFGGRAGPVSSEPESDKMLACGTHGRYWKIRGYTVVPLIEIKGEIEP